MIEWGVSGNCGNMFFYLDDTRRCLILFKIAKRMVKSNQDVIGE